MVYLGSWDKLVLVVVKNAAMYSRLRWFRVKNHLVSVLCIKSFNFSGNLPTFLC